MSIDATTDQIEADRIALKNMFKAIAEYGRKVRLSRESNGELPSQGTPKEPVPEQKSQTARRRKHRRKKASI